MKTIDVYYKGSIKQAFIDDEDFELVNKYHWNYVKQGYAYGYKLPFVKGTKLIFMHRLIMGLTYGNKLQVDHIDHNGLNNQRNNIRTATHRQNTWNTSSGKNSLSKYLGVTVMIPRKIVAGKLKIYPKMYQARIKINDKTTHLGLFKNEEDAARKYDEYAKMMYGDFANLNFKEDNYEKAIAI